MSRPWILVTPSSRGIGAALTRHLLRTTTAPILATARHDPDAVKENLLKDLLPLPSTTTTTTTTTTAAAAAAADRLHVLTLDVTDESTIQSAADRARELFPPPGGGVHGSSSSSSSSSSRNRIHNQNQHHLHLAFALPGILHAEKSLRQVSAAEALLTYRVNTLGPLLLMKHFEEFLPRKRTGFVESPPPPPGDDDDDDDGMRRRLLLLPRHAVWVNMSARVGSVSDNRKGGWYSYRSSKAAVNSITKSFDLQLVTRSGDKAMAMAYHPGTVRTDLSREYWETVAEDKLFSPEFAAERMVEVATAQVGLEGRGRCWDWKGEEILP